MCLFLVVNLIFHAHLSFGKRAYFDNKFTEKYIIETLGGGCPKQIVVGAIGLQDLFGYGIFFEESN